MASTGNLVTVALLYSETSTLVTHDDDDNDGDGHKHHVMTSCHGHRRVFVCCHISRRTVYLMIRGIWEVFERFKFFSEVFLGSFYGAS